MQDSKTVRSADIDILCKRQREDIDNMRSSLMLCSTVDPLSSKNALQNITILRVYHQLSRIIRYTELMDKIEEKLYQSIESALDRMDVDNDFTWMRLAKLQEQLQKSMIESHKLLEPYLNYENLTVIDSAPVADVTYADMILDRDSRDKVRASAQKVLDSIKNSSSEDNLDE